MAEPEDQTTLMTLTAEIVAAYAAFNSIKGEELSSLIASVHGALSAAGEPSVPAEAQTSKATPSQIKKSITPDALISFVDGKPYRTLKRHLTTNGTSPDEYRAKYGLPRDYPMTAANYSAMRSEAAKRLGLGNRRAAEAKAPASKRGGRKPAAPAPEAE